MIRYLAAALVTLAACAPAGTSADRPAPPAVAELTVTAEQPAGYDRDLFGEPDRPALLTDSWAAHGCYLSEADRLCHTDPRDVHVDHLVPLAEAWASGLDPADADEFGADPANLWLMTATLNMAKGDGDPAEWLPPAGDACGYVDRWLTVKATWDLTVDPAEAYALELVLTDC